MHQMKTSYKLKRIWDKLDGMCQGPLTNATTHLWFVTAFALLKTPLQTHKHLLKYLKSLLCMLLHTYMLCGAGAGFWEFGICDFNALYSVYFLTPAESCQGLRNPAHHLFAVHNAWQPNGCTLHRLTPGKSRCVSVVVANVVMLQWTFKEILFIPLKVKKSSPVCFSPKKGCDYLLSCSEIYLYSTEFLSSMLSSRQSYNSGPLTVVPNYMKRSTTQLYWCLNLIWFYLKKITDLSAPHISWKTLSIFKFFLIFQDQCRGKYSNPKKSNFFCQTAQNHTGYKHHYDQGGGDSHRLDHVHSNTHWSLYTLIFTVLFRNHRGFRLTFYVI